MNIVAGHLLCCLGLEQEELAFWMLRHITENIVPGRRMVSKTCFPLS